MVNKALDKANVKLVLYDIIATGVKWKIEAKTNIKFIVT